MVKAIDLLARYRANAESTLKKLANASFFIDLKKVNYCVNQRLNFAIEF